MNTKKTAISFFVSIFLFGVGTPNKAVAAGIPVVDAAAILQAVIEYRQILVEWGHTFKYYTDAIETFRILNERIKAFDKFTSGDIAEMLSIVTPYFGQEQLNVLLSLDPESPDFVEKILFVLDEDMGRSVKKFEDLESIIVSFEGDPLTYQAEAERNEYVQRLYVDEVSKAARASKLAEGRHLAIGAYGLELKQLGPESDLATAQLTAGELHLVAQQNEEIIRSMNEAAVANKHESMLSASSEAEEREKELDYIASRHNISFSPVSSGDPTVK